MMKKLILAFSAIALFAACKKEDTIDASKTRYLMDSYWQLKGSSFNPDISDPLNVDTENYADLQQCRKDNSYKFWSPTDFALYEGNIKCDVSMPDTTAMFWKFTSGETSILVYKSQGDPDHTIYWYGDITYKTIDTFVLTYTNTDDQGVISRTTETYVKQ